MPADNTRPELEREALLPVLSDRLLKLACEGHWKVRNDPCAMLEFMAACKHATEPQLLQDGKYRLSPDPELFTLRVEKLHKPPLGNGYQTVGQVDIPPGGEHYLLRCNAGAISAHNIPDLLSKLDVHLNGLVGLAVMSRVL